MVAEKPVHYTALARRFRPQAFNDVIGQNHVAQALQNAIKTSRVAHAYLFTGARGVGKTSTARILAKALNCPNVTDGIPCNDCEICNGITSGNDVDVLEIDGASNRGIDDIRSLRANVNVRSMRTQFKMYIIDEVHMLTKEAFNALLKTLEEPPPNVKFVFCTTEPNKVPDTILSRCQRFDFSSISTDNIVGRLQQIAAAEGFEVQPEAIDLVARRAAGSMRDSQSLFDQLLAFGGQKITADDVHRLFGTADDDRLIAIFAAVIDRRQADVLGEFDSALSQGVQASEFFDQLLSYARDLMLLASGANTVSLQSVSESNRDKLAAQAEKWGLQTVVAAMQILADTRTRLARVTHGRSLIELGLVRISMLEDLTHISELLKAVASGNLSDVSAPKKKTPQLAPQTDTQPASAQSSNAQSATQQSPSLPSTTAQPAPNSSGPGATAGSRGNAERVPQDVAPAEAASANVTSSDISSDGPNRPPEDRDAGQSKPSATDQPPTATPAISEPPVHSTAPPAAPVPTDSTDHIAPTGDEQSTETEVSSPQKAVQQVELREGNEAQFLREMQANVDEKLKPQLQRIDSCAIFAPNRLELRVPKSYTFSKRMLEQPENVSKLQNAALGIAGQPVQISFSIVDKPAETSKSPAAERSKPAQMKAEIPADDEFVQHAADIFGGTVQRVLEL